MKTPEQMAEEYIDFSWENTAMDKIGYYIAENTRGNQQPEKIWLNKTDFQAIYKEMEAYQRKHNKPMYAPEETVKAGYRAFIFLGSEIIFNPDAEPLPALVKEMKSWINKPHISWSKSNENT